MASLSVDLRPKSLSEFVGNASVVAALQKQLKDRVPPAILFTGMSGTGKTTLSYLVADLVGGEVQDKNCASETGVDQTRAWIEDARFVTFTGKRKVYVLNEIHKLTPQAQESLLPILEDPISNVLWVGNTTEVEKLVKPVRKRFLEYALKPLGKEDVTKLLVRACEVSGAQDFHQRDNFIDYTVKCKVGSARDILVAYEKLISGVPQTEVYVDSNAEPLFRDIAFAVVNGDWEKTRGYLELVKTADSRGLRAVVSAFLRSALIKCPLGPKAEALSGCLIALGNGGFEDGIAYSVLCGALYRTCARISGK